MKFKKITASLVFFCAISLCAEDLNFDSKLSGWIVSNKPNVTVENGTGTEGAAVRLKENSGISRHMKLEPDTMYRISFQIKGENISSESDQGAMILLNSGKKWYRITSLFANKPETGTFDWRKGEEIINTADFPDTTKVRILLRLSCSGTAWYKDLKLEAMPSDSRGAESLADALKFDRKLMGWKIPSAKNIALDEEVKIGERSVRLENGGRAWKTLQLEPDTRYELSFYIKGREIRGGKNQGAAILLNSGKKWERISSLPGDPMETGTFDWRKGSGIIDTSRYPSPRIRLGLVLAGEGTVWFDELRLTKKKSESAAVKQKKTVSFRRAYGELIRSAALVPQGIFGFFEPKEPVKLKFFIDGKAKQYEYTLRVRDEAGNTVFTQGKTALTDEITLPGQERGYYSLESDIYADGKKAYTIQGGFCSAPLPGKRDPFFRFGYGVIPEMHDAYKRIGCGGINLKFHWRTWQNLPAKQNVENDLKEFKRFLESGDYHLAGSLNLGLDRRFMRSKQELDGGWPLLSDRWINQYVEYIDLIVPKVKINEWHGGVEIPSSASMKWKYCGTWSEAMSNFVVLARIGSRRMKKIDPKIKFIAGGNNVMERMSDIEPIHMGDLAPDIDGYLIDAYTGNWDIDRGSPTIPEVSLMQFYRQASDLARRLGMESRICNDEFGYSIRYGAPFDHGSAVELARLCARAIIISKAAPVKELVLYRPIAEVRANTGDSDRHMAAIWKTILVDGKAHRVPLPGGAAYAVASSELAFAEYKEEIIHENIYSYIFTKPDGSVLVTLWNIEKQQPFPLALPKGNRILNMYGRDITGKPLSISPEPVYITVRKPVGEVAETIRKVIREISPEFICTSLPGSIFVRSFVKTTRDAEIRIPGKKPLPVKILPDRVNVFRVESARSAELVAASGTYPIRAERIPMHRLKRVSGMEELRRGEPGILKYPDHIRPIEALQPERCHFKSDYNPNGHNVSAKYWTGCDDRNFYFAAEVDDPVHVQHFPPKELWRGDSVQFVFSPEDHVPPDMRSKADKVPSSEYNFGLALTPEGTRLVKYLGKDAGVKEYPSRVTRAGGITRYEAVIPWSAVGGKAKRFGFVIFDSNKASDKSAPYRLEFSPGVTGSGDSGKLTLLQYQ